MIKRVLSYTQKILPLHGYQKAVYFFFYAALHQKEFTRWFDFIETNLPDGFSEELKIGLALRGAFRFVRARLTLTQRLDILIAYYTTITQSFSKAGISTFFGNSGLQLSELTGRSGKKYFMKMTSFISKEGTFRIMLSEPEKTPRLASISGIIGVDKDGQRVLWVGSLQGAMSYTEKLTATEGRQAVVEATKDLNGLRPKQAVLQAICSLALWFDVKTVIAPSYQNQIAIKNFFKGQKIHTEYDAFWEEYTGSATDSYGDYCLTLPLPRRQLADVQQKRRKDWQLRYARIDALSSDIAESLKSLQ